MRRNRAFAICVTGGLALVAPLACEKKTAGTTSTTAPAQTPTDKKVAYWYDPMKPEVHFDHPGKSPFMDMQLAPKYADEAPGNAAAVPTEKKILYWYDSMNPQHRSDRPGKAPDGMDLVPRYADTASSAAAGGPVPAGYSVVHVPLARLQEIGVTTATVERRPIGGILQTNGVIAEDEARIHAVNAKFAGYVERLFVDRTGQPVRRGEPLLTVYSPELVATERELLLAVENARRLQGSSSGGASSDAESLLAATRQRLRLWDIAEPEIDRIQKSGKVSRDLTLFSPASGVVLKKDAVEGMAITPGMSLYTIADLSVVWVLADVYQSEMRSVQRGNSSEISTSSLPDETFPGRVDFVYPTLSEDSRTIKVRIVVPNPRGLLKPGMFVRASLQGKPRDVLAVPRSAVIETGDRKIAFVEQSPGMYAPREVRTGASAGGFVEVLAGLSPGETVVTSANFLIDSESRIGGTGVGAPLAGSAGRPPPTPREKPDGSR